MHCGQRVLNSRRHLIMAVLLPVILLACSAPGGAEEKPAFLASVRVKSLAWLVDSIVAMPEISCVDKGVDGGLRGLLPPDLLSALDQVRVVTWGVPPDGKGGLKTVIRVGETVVTTDEHSSRYVDPLQMLMNPGRQAGNTEQPEPLPAFSPDLEKAEIAGWIEPSVAAHLLETALSKESALETNKNVRRCGSNCRRISRLLARAETPAEKLRKGEPVALASMPVCPFGGRYLSDGTVASGSKRIYQVRCNHAPPPPPPPIPDTPLGRTMGIALGQLRNLPAISFTYSASEGVLRAELPAIPGETGFAVPGSGWNPDYGSMIGWVPAEKVRLPLSAGFPGGVFLAIDPRRLFADPSQNERLDPLRELAVEPGLILLGGTSSPSRLSRRGMMPNPVLGVFTASKELVPALRKSEPGLAGRQSATEIEGTDVTVLTTAGDPRSDEGENAGLHVIEQGGITFMSFEKRFMRELLRGGNGESPLVALPELRGEVKFAMAVRMDVFGHAAAGILAEVAFDRERRRCMDAVYAFRQKAERTPDAELERNFSGPGGIPKELQDSCARKGVMWHPEQKRLMCAVHESGWWRPGDLPTAPLVEGIPADRWLFVTLCRNDGKAVLEARIVTGKEAGK